MKYFRYLLFLSLLLTVLPVQTSRILCIFPYNGRSHYQVTGALCQALAERGHQIDMISHFSPKTPIANYTHIVNLQGTRKAVVNSFTLKYAKQIDSAVVFYIATTFGNELCDLMGHERMQKFIKNPPNDPPYDLVITEVNKTKCSQCAYFYSSRLKWEISRSNNYLYKKFAIKLYLSKAHTIQVVDKKERNTSVTKDRKKLIK